MVGAPAVMDEVDEVVEDEVKVVVEVWGAITTPLVVRLAVVERGA